MATSRLIGMSGRANTFWVTAQDGGTDHAVAQTDVVVGTGASGGGYRAVCGATFWPAAMISEPGVPCQRCLRHMQALATLRGAASLLDNLPSPRRELITRQFLADVASKQERVKVQIREARLVPSALPSREACAAFTAGASPTQMRAPVVGMTGPLWPSADPDLPVALPEFASDPERTVRRHLLPGLIGESAPR